MSGGLEFAPGCVPGGVVKDLVLSDGEVIVNARDCCLTVGLEVGGQDEAGVTVRAVLFVGRELPLPAPSSEEVWKRGISGCGESWELEASCGCRGDTGVEGSEDWVWHCMETCWADSARARANMRAEFLGGGGGGGAVVGAVELRSFEESGATTPWRSWLLAAGACCMLSSPFSS